jgi:GntR family transcriptional repressor for pyruvate dehydrogenase complex
MVQTLEIGRIKRTSASELAMNSILDLIRRRVLRPSDPLPSQRDLVVRMGLSRAALREGLSALSSLGVLEISHGRTTFVRKIAPEFLVDSELLFLLLERATLLHSIEVRRVLEVEAIGFAAERATAEDLEELERLLRQIERAVASGEKPLGHSAAFHLAISKATHNPVLIDVVKPFIRLISRASDTIAATPGSGPGRHPGGFPPTRRPIRRPAVRPGEAINARSNEV